MDLRVAMVGLAHGHGTGFLKSLATLPGVKVVGFFDSENPQAARQAAEEFGAPAYEDLDQLLRHAGANMMLTAAINDRKAQYIVKAIDAGLHCMADKPLVSSMEELESIEDALARNKSVKLYLMLTERFNAARATAKQLVDRGEIGRVANIVAIRPHRLNPDSRPAWMFDSRRYGGILNDIGIHDLDIARWFTGNEMDQILSASVSNMRSTAFTDFNDNGEAMIRMKDGAIAFIYVHWMTPDAYPAHGETRFIITGTKGQIEVNSPNQTVQYYSDTTPPTQLTPVPLETTIAMDMAQYFTDSQYRPVLTTQDAILTQRAILQVQAFANNG